MGLKIYIINKRITNKRWWTNKTTKNRTTKWDIAIYLNLNKIKTWEDKCTMNNNSNKCKCNMLILIRCKKESMVKLQIFLKQLVTRQLQVLTLFKVKITLWAIKQFKIQM